MEVREPIDRYLSPEQAKRFYDRLGSKQDWQAFYENSAVDDLVSHATFDSAHSVLEFGCGTGALAARLLQHRLPPNARYVGFDISSTMVAIARNRLKPWSGRARVCQSNGSPHIDEPDRVFDRFVSAYVFDLLAPEFIAQLLSEAHRLLVPRGKLCLVSLTFGTSHFTRAVSWGWQRLWRISPVIGGGCRPIELSESLRREQWELYYQTRVVSWGITSEILVALAR